MIKIVLDTNMFLSGFLFHGMLKTVFDLILGNKLQMFVSEALVGEITKKLAEFEADKQIQREVLLFINSRGVLIRPKGKVTVCRDPKDNYLLELAQEGQANYLITRDKDLLELSAAKWKDTKIVKPESFLHILRGIKVL